MQQNVQIYGKIRGEGEVCGGDMYFFIIGFLNHVFEMFIYNYSKILLVGFGMYMYMLK